MAYKGSGFRRKQGFSSRGRRIFKRGGQFTSKFRSKVVRAATFNEPIQRRVEGRNPPMFKLNKPFTRTVRLFPGKFIYFRLFNLNYVNL